MISPPDLQRLPPSAHQELTDFLNECESALAWPSQLMYVLGAILPKPDEAERIVGLLPMHVPPQPPGLTIRCPARIPVCARRALRSDPIQ